MMLGDLLTKRTIQYSNKDNMDWKSIIKLAAEPLVINGSIAPTYVDAMITISEEDGPYFNIGPEIVLAHARPEDGSNTIALSLLKTNQEVDLIDEKHPAKLWFVLASKDNNSHLEVIKELMQLLTNKVKVDALLSAKSVSNIKKIIG